MLSNEATDVLRKQLVLMAVSQVCINLGQTQAIRNELENLVLNAKAEEIQSIVQQVFTVKV